MKKRYGEVQIVRILKESEEGMAVRDVCRKHNVSEQTFYRWKKRYGGMDIRRGGSGTQGCCKIFPFFKTDSARSSSSTLVARSGRCMEEPRHREMAAFC